MNDPWKNLILDHYKNPRRFAEPTDFDLSAEQYNRTCGDFVKVFAKVQGDVADFHFTGAGCSLCLASASLMMELLDGASLKDAAELQEKFDEVWESGAQKADADTWQALSGLRAYPVRSRCVKLPWQALDSIVQSAQN